MLFDKGLGLPSKQTAIIAGEQGEFKVVHDAPVIELEPEQIIVRTAALALNPADTKMIGDFITPGGIFGFDCAGTVIKVGDAVKKDLKPGDRVCGSADGMNKNRPWGGGFCEYASLPGDMSLKIPDAVSFEAASALGTALSSAGLALFYSLRLDPNLLKEPAKEAFPVLVYGGSTSTGTMCLQLIKLYVLRVPPAPTQSSSLYIQHQTLTHPASSQLRSPPHHNLLAP